MLLTSGLLLVDPEFRDLLEGFHTFLVSTFKLVVIQAPETVIFIVDLLKDFLKLGITGCQAIL